MFFLFIGSNNYNQPPKSSEEPTCRKSTLPHDTLSILGALLFPARDGQGRKEVREMDLNLMYAKFLKDVIDQGFEVPIYAITVGNNGFIEAGQYDISLIGEGLKFTELANYTPVSEMVKLPINIILIDNTGKAARCLIQTPNEQPEIKILN